MFEKDGELCHTARDGFVRLAGFFLARSLARRGMGGAFPQQQPFQNMSCRSIERLFRVFLSSAPLLHEKLKRRFGNALPMGRALGALRF